MNVYDAVATVGWILLVCGWWFRKDRRRHLSFVLPGMAVDLGLVLWLEFTRSVFRSKLAWGHWLVWLLMLSLIVGDGAATIEGCAWPAIMAPHDCT